MRRSLLLLAAGLAATLAACTPYDPAGIYSVASVNGSLYAWEFPGGEYFSCSPNADHCRVWARTDGDWALLGNPGNDVLRALDEPFETEICTVSMPPLDCYTMRLRSVTTAEGEVWSLSPGRHEFIDKQGQRPIVLRDIAANETTVIVAAGQEGLLVGGPDASWNRIGLGSVIPTPTSSFLAGLAVELF